MSREMFIQTADAVMAESGLITWDVPRPDGEHIVRQYYHPEEFKRAVDTGGLYGVVHVCASKRELARCDDLAALARTRALKAAANYQRGEAAL